MNIQADSTSLLTHPTYGLRSLCLSAILCSLTTINAASASSAITFDLPPTAVAVPACEPSVNMGCLGDKEPVEVTLRLSSLISGNELPEIDRWMIRCVPRSSSWQVVDYAPRTETTSDLATPIEVKTSDEENQAIGMAADVSHGHLVRGHLGMDQGSKKSETLTFTRRAPLHAVTASGTIERGRGVYYKLRWTSTQVLEGEKEFRITFNVPAGFRAGLLDVNVVAIGRPAKSGGVTEAFSQIPVLGDDASKMRPIGEARFVVAIYAEGDPVAGRAAQSMADAESTLRREARHARATSPTRSLSTLFRHVAAKLDVDSVDLQSDWIERIVFADADPYMDPVIRKLPTQLRVLTLDYCDARRHLENLQTRELEQQSTQFQLSELVKASIENESNR